MSLHQISWLDPTRPDPTRPDLVFSSLKHRVADWPPLKRSDPTRHGVGSSRYRPALKYTRRCKTPAHAVCVQVNLLSDHPLIDGATQEAMSSEGVIPHARRSLINIVFDRFRNICNSSGVRQHPLRSAMNAWIAGGYCRPADWLMRPYISVTCPSSALHRHICTDSSSGVPAPACIRRIEYTGSVSSTCVVQSKNKRATFALFLLSSSDMRRSYRSGRTSCWDVRQCSLTKTHHSIDQNNDEAALKKKQTRIRKLVLEFIKLCDSSTARVCCHLLGLFFIIMSGFLTWLN